ncbi:MAG: hypothetical protein N2483_06680, partial [Burkholderiaceae bacterium]|nr:hypothetical protein [Burkholderiaceae bacterium]
FPEGLRSEEEFGRFRAEVPGPLVANMTEFGVTPLLPLALDRTRPGVRLSPPPRGAHTRELLAGLGFVDAQIADFLHQAIVA